MIDLEYKSVEELEFILPILKRIKVEQCGDTANWPESYAYVESSLGPEYARDSLKNFIAEIEEEILELKNDSEEVPI